MLRKNEYQLFVVIFGVISFIVIFCIVFIFCLGSRPAIGSKWPLPESIPSALENPALWLCIASFMGLFIASVLTIWLVRRLLERKPWEKQE